MREFSIEVAQFGKKEICCRPDKENKAKKKQDKLLTSELEELTMQEQLANQNVIISTHIQVNKPLAIHDMLQKIKLQKFDIVEYEQHLIDQIDKKDRHINR